ncbi:NAD(+) synthetase [Halobacteriales archaeon QS_4_66_20]|nr:MAG: NAD(+) synthetase [Halobacteriales archaeon QS_4_66_20]
MPETVRASEPLELTFSDAELEKHREHITSFIRDTYEGAGADTAVIAISGGVDSSLTSFLAVEALGTENVYGLVMPSEVNRTDNMSDAERVAGELLEIEYDLIEIDPLVEAFCAANPNVTIGEEFTGSEQVAVGNLRARIRAVLNYFAANRRGGLVVGTGNRTEAAVGYFTKYGDGAVDCHPIANLYKQQVRQLARHVGVPGDMADKPSTAGLWEAQTDEGELGMTYDTLDSIIALHVDGPLSVSATARTIGVDEDAIERVRRMYEASAHKRQAPPGPDPL